MWKSWKSDSQWYPYYMWSYINDIIITCYLSHVKVLKKWFPMIPISHVIRNDIIVTCESAQKMIPNGAHIMCDHKWHHCHMLPVTCKSAQTMIPNSAHIMCDHKWHHCHMSHVKELKKWCPMMPISCVTMNDIIVTCYLSHSVWKVILKTFTNKTWSWNSLSWH
jgi:hypothetical protein